MQFHASESPSESKNSIGSEGTGHVVQESTSWTAKILKEVFIPCCYNYIKIFVLFVRVLCANKLEEGRA